MKTPLPATTLVLLFGSALLAGCPDDKDDTADTYAETDTDTDTDADSDSDSDSDADADSDADTDTTPQDGSASDITEYPLDCETDGSLYQNILTATSSSVSDADTNPQVTVTWEKCDGSSFSTTKDCHVRVGSFTSTGVVRTEFTWKAGATSNTTTFDGWPGTSPFSDEACGAIKEFYLTCDDGSAEAHWYSGDPVVIEKICP